MPQISHIKYSDIQEAYRFDAEYFKNEVISLLKSWKIDFINLGEDIKEFKTGDNLEQVDIYDTNNNVLFLRTWQIRQIYIDNNNLTKVKNPIDFHLIWMIFILNLTIVIPL